jgi:DNA-binding protein HU-beta
MNKADLINQVASQTGLSKTKATEAIESFIKAVTESLSNNERVILSGFGTFQTVERKARKGRNPQNGAEINIPAKRVAKFKAGANFNKQVNA